MTYNEWRELYFPAFYFGYGALRNVVQATAFANWYVSESVEMNDSHAMAIEWAFDKWTTKENEKG